MPPYPPHAARPIPRDGFSIQGRVEAAKGGCFAFMGRSSVYHERAHAGVAAALSAKRTPFVGSAERELAQVLGGRPRREEEEGSAWARRGCWASEVTGRRSTLTK